MATVQGYFRLDDRLTSAEAASYLGVKMETLNTWRCKNKGPAYYKMGRVINYTRRDLDAYLDLNMRRVATAEMK